jgi:KUP system potassium uptake protein
MRLFKAQSGFGLLALGALGVVYGDIGTSPLYAIKEVFTNARHPVPITADNVLGLLSLIFWSLMVVVSLKYVVLVLRADNRGEGGIMALMALALGDAKGRVAGAMIMLGLCGAALFYGDSAITPAISVLSAIEGLEIATPAFKPFVIPITLLVLVGLFVFQRRGTARVGSLFGPVMLVWFTTLLLLGAAHIVQQPTVLKALHPSYAVQFAASDPLLAFFTLAAVFLVLTGAEALYADLGHFGPKPIRFAWFAVVLPALVINYFGQGALILRTPEAVQSPFYLMAPEWALYPLVLLSTAATVIASQAVISGAYSMTQQAMQFGYLPRLEVVHTSSSEIGQVYLPAINWTLLLVVAGLVLAFRSSSNLGAAYGFSVSGTMVITTFFAMMVACRRWKWSRWQTGAVFGTLLAVDLLFFAANGVKVVDGAWFPLAFGAAVFILLTTWKRGREALQDKIAAEAMRLPDLIAAIERAKPPTVLGTAVFMTARPTGAPLALLHNLKHNKVLHERVVLANVNVLAVPRLKDSERVAVRRLNERFYCVKIYFGFMERPDVPSALEWCAEQGLALQPAETSYFLGRETPSPTAGSKMAHWRSNLFAAIYGNSRSAADHFMLPLDRVVELRARVAL